MTHPGIQGRPGPLPGHGGRIPGNWMATADLGEDSWDVGVGDTPQEAVRAALRALGEPDTSELAEGVRLG